MVHQKTKLLEWDIPEFEYKEKKNDWFWGIGLAALVGVVLSIIAGNYLLAVFVVLATVLVFVYARRQPRIMHMEISEQGIKVNDVLYPYTNLISFWIIYSENKPSLLLLRVNRLLDPMAILPIHPNVELESLREWLLVHLVEEEMQEPIAHQLSDRIGF